MASVHSLFPPSAAKRLLMCPGAYGSSLVVGAGARRASVFSAEGTLAHLVAETMILAKVEGDHFLGRTYEVDGFLFTVDRDFLDAVQVYVDYIESLISLGFVVALERLIEPAKLWDDRPPLAIELFGTADCIAFHPEWKRLVLVDLKFGKGVPVDPEDNPQLLYYAAGALADTHTLVQWVNLVVAQPRLVHGDGPIRKWTTTPKHVIAWARDTLYPGVQTALADNGQTLLPGEHCQFCPAAPTCPAPRTMALDLARQRFAEAGAEDVPADPNSPDPLAGMGKATSVSDTRLVEILDASRVIEPLIEQARQMAKDRIQSGVALPGWEIVTRAGRRTWSASSEDLFRKLRTLRADPFLVAEAMSPAAMEKKAPTIYAMLESDVAAGTPSLVLQPKDHSRKRTRQPALAISAGSDMSDSNG